MESIEKTNEVIKTLLLEGRIDRNLWTEDLVLTPGELGLTLHDGAYIWPDRPDLLNDAEIARSTDLTKLKVFHAVDSTSTVLLARANQRSVDRWLYTAECQVRGRGRRGDLLPGHPWQLRAGGRPLWHQRRPCLWQAAGDDLQPQLHHGRRRAAGRAPSCT